MPLNPKADPYIALRTQVAVLNKGRSLRERIRELRWKRVREVSSEVSSSCEVEVDLSGDGNRQADEQCP